jgi:DNA polymerase-3 subunit epsilon
VLVAHNSNFDLNLLNQEIARVFPGCRMRNPDLCTVQLARRVAPSLKSYNLDALADHFGIEIKERHRAAGDARATAQVLLRLLDDLEIGGVRTLHEARSFNSAARTANLSVC